MFDVFLISKQFQQDRTMGSETARNIRKVLANEGRTDASQAGRLIRLMQYNAVRVLRWEKPRRGAALRYDASFNVYNKVAELPDTIRVNLYASLVTEMQVPTPTKITAIKKVLALSDAQIKAAEKIVQHDLSRPFYVTFRPDFAKPFGPARGVIPKELYFGGKNNVYEMHL